MGMGLASVPDVGRHKTRNTILITHNGITIDRRKRIITHNGEVHQFGYPRKGCDLLFETACHLILGSGFSVNEIFFKVYGEDPEGGPNEGPQIIHVVISQMITMFLTKLGLECRGWRIAGVNYYCIVSKYHLPDPKLRPVKRSARPSKIRYAGSEAGGRHA